MADPKSPALTLSQLYAQLTHLLGSGVDPNLEIRARVTESMGSMTSIARGRVLSVQKNLSLPKDTILFHVYPE